MRVWYPLAPASIRHHFPVLDHVENRKRNRTEICTADTNNLRKRDRGVSMRKGASGNADAKQQKGKIIFLLGRQQNERTSDRTTQVKQMREMMQYSHGQPPSKWMKSEVK